MAARRRPIGIVWSSDSDNEDSYMSEERPNHQRDMSQEELRRLFQYNEEEGFQQDRVLHVEWDEPMASDNSDYSMGDSDDAASDEEDSISCESEDLFQPDIRPSHRQHEMSVEELRRRIAIHERAGTLCRFLKEEDSDAYMPHYSQPTDLDDTPVLNTKVYYTVLHFACLDTDGSRGEEKIRIILEAAKRMRIPMSLLFTTTQVYVARMRPNEWRILDGNDAPPSRDALCILLDNRHSTVGAVRIICEAWPQVVTLTNVDRSKREISSLIRLMKHAYSWDECERAVAIAEVLLDAAEKTAMRALGLASSTDTLKRSMAQYNYGQLNDENTVFYFATRHQPHPHRFLPLFLKAWPDALKYCRESKDIYLYGSAPLHNVCSSVLRSYRYLPIDAPVDSLVTTRICYESRMESIVAFLQFSSLEALAFAFLATDQNAIWGFDAVMNAMQYSHGSSEEWKEYINSVLQQVVGKHDEHGRTLLHYVAACSTDVSEEELRVKERKIRGGLDLDADPTPAQQEALRREQEALEQQKLRAVLHVCKQVLAIGPSAALVRDSQGMTPFHFAMASGKRWDSGLKDLVGLLPYWARARNSETGLYPFMSAATPQYTSGDEAIELAYELLRHDPSIIDIE